MNELSHISDEEMIQSLWADDECLDLDSVQFGTGEVFLLDIPNTTPDATTTIEIRVRDTTTIRAAALLPGVTLRPGLSASAAPPIVIDKHGMRITGGECAAYGAFGYIAASRISDNRLIWLAFFQHSNPFSLLSITDDTLTATTNLGAKYIFPLHSPQQVQVNPQG